MSVPQFIKTPDQKKAIKLLGSPAKFILLFGGSRSGKTFILIYALIHRALKESNSRHVILRFRFNHVKTSVWYDTFPKVMKLCFPQYKYKENKSDWFVEFDNGSQIWFGGLDDKERTEKILGNEYTTIYLNECSQISYHAVNIVLTRLAQKTKLKNKFYADCNPPSKRHWTYKLFIRYIDPDTNETKDSQQYKSMLMNPDGNKHNLSEDYLQVLEGLPKNQKDRFLLGKFVDEVTGSLWNDEIINRNRVVESPRLKRIIIALDPSTTDTKDSDECGIMVGGVGFNNEGYLLGDYSGIMSPKEWASKAIYLYYKYKADRVVAETNNGGDMIRTIIHQIDRTIPYISVHASRGKKARAEPIAALYEQNKIHHVGTFDKAEEEMTTWQAMEGEKSPNRIDANVWLFTALMLKIGQGITSYTSAMSKRR